MPSRPAQRDVSRHYALKGRHHSVSPVSPFQGEGRKAGCGSPIPGLKPRAAMWHPSGVRSLLRIDLCQVRPLGVPPLDTRCPSRLRPARRDLAVAGIVTRGDDAKAGIFYGYVASYFATGVGIRPPDG